MSDVKVAQPTFGHDNEKVEITHAEHRDVINDKESFVEHGAQHGSPTLDIVYVPGTAEEKALVRKMDRRLLPILWLMYGKSEFFSAASKIWALTSSLLVSIQLSGQNQYRCELLLFSSKPMILG